ncbi:MAG: CHAP domain-containing protein [Chitinophagales bacterium]
MLLHNHTNTRMMQLLYAVVTVSVLILGIVILQSLQKSTAIQSETLPEGTVMDSLHGVYVYYNGNTEAVRGKSYSADGYYFGLRWQCVEFVRRYYYQHLGHIIPDAEGNAKDLFNTDLPDASYNTARDLVQYANPSLKKPQADDIIVFAGTRSNPFGHVAIVAEVTADSVFLIQQNAGPDEDVRMHLALLQKNDHWQIQNKHVVGWMRIE